MTDFILTLSAKINPLPQTASHQAWGALARKVTKATAPTQLRAARPSHPSPPLHSFLPSPPYPSPMPLPQPSSHPFPTLFPYPSPHLFPNPLDLFGIGENEEESFSSPRFYVVLCLTPPLRIWKSERVKPGEQALGPLPNDWSSEASTLLSKGQSEPIRRSSLFWVKTRRYSLNLRTKQNPSTVAHPCNPYAWDAEAGASLLV